MQHASSAVVFFMFFLFGVNFIVRQKYAINIGYAKAVADCRSRLLPYPSVEYMKAYGLDAANPPGKRAHLTL